MTDVSERKQAGRRWKAGQSGNPNGRPKGSGFTGELRNAIAAQAGGIVAAMVNKALEGDVQAARALLDRVLPALKAESAAVHLHGLTTGTLTERAQSALQAAGAGEVAPDVAVSLVAAVGALARLQEIDELERRIAAMEERINGDTE